MTQTTEATGEIVPRSAALPEIKRLMGRFEIDAQSNAEGNREIALQIMESILSAETAEEVFERQEAGTISGQQYIDKPFELSEDGITWKRSAGGYVEGGAFPYYCIMRVRDLESDEEFPVSCGGMSFVATLARLEELDYFGKGPRTLQIQAKKVGSGFEVLLLKPYKVLAPKTEPKSGKSGT